MTGAPRHRTSIGVHGLLLVALAVGSVSFARPTPGAAGADTDIAAVKGLMFFQFAKFVEWPALADKASIVMCVVGDDQLNTALAAAASGQIVGGHPAEVRRPDGAATWRSCHLLFVGDSEARRSTVALSAVRAMPILTVSDASDFAKNGGIVEMYVENGRVAFAINTDAADRAGLRLSSQLLRLAKITRGTHAP